LRMDTFKRQWVYRLDMNKMENCREYKFLEIGKMA